MELPDRTDIHQNGEKIIWAELIIYIANIREFDFRQTGKWRDCFGAVTCAAQVARPDSLAEDIRWVCTNKQENKAEIWNQLLQASSKEWVLFIEQDEQPVMQSLPAHKPDNTCWPPVLCKSGEFDTGQQQYQIRLVRNNGEKIFTGKNLPDATLFITENKIKLTDKPVLILTKKKRGMDIDPLDELSVYDPSPQTYLILGEQYFKKGKYVHAAAQYRQVLKKNKLLPFDHLAAINGLAGCLTEQYKWPQAQLLVEQSLNTEEKQRMPYLIQFRILQLKKQWKEAYKILSRFYKVMNINSRANFDKTISEEDTLTELGELALKAGMTRKAVEHFEELYSYKDGEVERAFVQRLFVLSVDLNDYDKAVFYFECLFSPYIPDKLSRKAMQQLNECTDFFMKKGWYEYVLKIYEQLVEEHPNNNDFRRRLVVALSKTDRMDRARELIAFKT